MSKTVAFTESEADETCVFSWREAGSSLVPSNVGALLSLLMEVQCVGSDWGRGVHIRAVLKALQLLCCLFCGHVGRLGSFSLPRLIWQVVFCVLCAKHHKSMKHVALTVFLSFLLLTKASSNGQSNLGHVCPNLRRSWCILGACPSPCWHVSPNVGALLASRGGMLEVIGAVGSMLKALLLLLCFCGDVRPLGCFFSAV